MLCNIDRKPLYGGVARSDIPTACFPNPVPLLFAVCYGFRCKEPSAVGEASGKVVVKRLMKGFGDTGCCCRSGSGVK
jgi:hypothetical protein